MVYVAKIKILRFRHLLMERSRAIQFLLFLLMALIFFKITSVRLISVNDDSSKVHIREIQNENLEVPLVELLKGPYALPEDNPLLLQYIKSRISPPSTMPYILANPHVEDPSLYNLPKHIINILGEMKNGFFVECGAVDGEKMSNTLLFERKYDWKGLLIEANPTSYASLIKRNRKSWSIEACLSQKTYPTTVLFQMKWIFGKIVASSSPTDKLSYSKVECLPLYSILLALNITTIDFFSLDIEGKELEVLKTIPWDKVNIRTLAVEYVNIINGEIELPKYLESVGYFLYASSSSTIRGLDFIFHRKDIIPHVKHTKNMIRTFQKNAL